MWSYFLFSALFVLDVIMLVCNFRAGNIVSSCFDSFYVGMLSAIALDWWIDNKEK